VDGGLPALLQALKPDYDLYQEARDEFYRTSVNLTRRPRPPNEPFIKVEPSLVRHVLIPSWEWPFSPYKNLAGEVVNHVTERLSQYPKLETITIRGTASNEWRNLLARNEFISAHFPVILSPSGSMFNLRKIVIQIEGLHSLDLEPAFLSGYGARECRKLMDNISIYLGIVAKLERISPTDQHEVWFWEADDGRYLRFKKLTELERKQRSKEFGWPVTPRRNVSWRRHGWP